MAPTLARAETIRVNIWDDKPALDAANSTGAAPQPISRADLEALGAASDASSVKKDVSSTTADTAVAATDADATVPQVQRAPPIADDDSSPASPPAVAPPPPPPLPPPGYSRHNDGTSSSQKLEQSSLYLASINELVLTVTSIREIDRSFIDAFFNTYRSFCLPQQLLEKLIERYNVPDWVAPETKSRVQIRVLVAMRTWVAYEPTLFAPLANTPRKSTETEQTAEQKAVHHALTPFLAKAREDGYSLLVDRLCDKVSSCRCCCRCCRRCCRTTCLLLLILGIDRLVTVVIVVNRTSTPKPVCRLHRPSRNCPKTCAAPRSIC
jgi:hypothetical protein